MWHTYITSMAQSDGTRTMQNTGGRRTRHKENNGNNVHNFIGATVDIAGTRVSIKLARCRKFQLTIICTNIFQDEDAPGCLELTDSDEVVLVYDGDELADSTVARPDPWLLDTAANGDC